MRAKRFRPAVVFCVLGLAAGAAEAADRRVPQQFDTITEAVAAANPGDRIVVSRGVYDESVQITVDNLTFMGRGAIWEAVNTGGGDNCMNVAADGITVTGFVFRHGDGHIIGDGNNLRIKGCRFRHSNGTAIDIDGNNAVVTACRFIGVDGLGIEIDGDDAAVTRNRLDGTGDNAIDIEGANALIERNNIKNVEDGLGINVTGDAPVVSRNVVNNADDDGIGFDATGKSNAGKARIDRNRVMNTEAGLDVDGDDVLVSRNKTLQTSGPGIEVDGDDMVVEFNVISHCNGGEGIDGNGDRMVVNGNRVAGVQGDAGISLDGAELRVTGNRVQHIADDSAGIAVDGPGANNRSVMSLIEGNSVRDSSDYAYDLTLQNSTVRNNTAMHVGSEGEPAFELSGNGNRIEKNRAIDVGGDGFQIEGSMNMVVGNLAKACCADGFDFDGGAADSDGTGNTLTNCTAISCDGEGLDNGSPMTIVTNNRFMNNRIDVTNDSSFATFTGNRFRTGGEMTPSEVD